MWDSEHWLGDDFTNLANKNICLVRKEADALFFFLKQFLLLEKQGAEVPAEWKAAVRRLGDALCNTVEEVRSVRSVYRHREDGDCHRTIHVGRRGAGGPGACQPILCSSRVPCRGRAIGAVVLHARCTGRRDDRRPCRGAAGARLGVVLSRCWSRSRCFTRSPANKEWLTAARDQAAQFATWVVSHDYQFPPTSTFGRMGMRTTGTVWANGQNRHSAPGICTASGEALLRLYRATGDRIYLELMRDIVQTGPQYVSRADRPIQALNESKLLDQSPGWMCERVQMSDWEVPGTPIGEMYYGPNSWCEASVMLSTTCNPGLYLQPDKGFAWSLDHIDAEVVRRSQGEITVRLENRTKFPARVRTLAEASDKAGNPLGFTAMIDSPADELAPAETKEIVSMQRECARLEFQSLTHEPLSMGQRSFVANTEGEELRVSSLGRWKNGKAIQAIVSCGGLRRAAREKFQICASGERRSEPAAPATKGLLFRITHGSAPHT